MKGETSRQITAIVSAIILLTSVVDARPKYIDCVDSAECGLGYCCSVGKGRYSIPRCVSLGEVGAMCHPKMLVPTNTTLSYPDQAMVELTNVYYIMCPCMTGLFCSEENALCTDPNDALNYNTIE